MNFKKINLNLIIKSLIIVFILVIISLFLILTLVFLSAYIHELGHANAAILSSMISHDNSTKLNFTYQKYILLGKDLGLKYPQQTQASVHKNFALLYNLSGVLFEILFYCIIFIFILKIKTINRDEYLPLLLFSIFILLIFQSIISNLFCGTDGFNIKCSYNFVYNIVPIAFLISTLSILTIFFIILFKEKIIRIIKIINSP